MFRSPHHQRHFFKRRDYFSQKTIYFFSKRVSKKFSTLSCETNHYPLKENKHQRAMHIVFTNVKGETAETLTAMVSDQLKQYPNSIATFMSPSIAIDYQEASNLRQRGYKGYLYPGHIYSTCISSNGASVPEGDLSYSAASTITMLSKVRTIPDTRLAGYQPAFIDVYAGKFTSMHYENNKWAQVAAVRKNYPLEILIRPFTDKYNREKYLANVSRVCKENRASCYALMGYYRSGTDEKLKPHNCISIHSRFAELFFEQENDIGDNPTTQTAFDEYMKNSCDVSLRHGFWHSAVKDKADSLLGCYQHREEASAVRYSFGVV